MPPFFPAYGPTEGPLGFPMLDRQARQLDTLLKALRKSKEHAYRKAVTAKAPTELNRGERSDVSWITTESVDRTQEVVARGMNDSQFAANPLVTLRVGRGRPVAAGQGAYAPPGRVAQREVDRIPAAEGTPCRRESKRKIRLA